MDDLLTVICKGGINQIFDETEYLYSGYLKACQKSHFICTNKMVRTIFEK